MIHHQVIKTDPFSNSPPRSRRLTQSAEQHNSLIAAIPEPNWVPALTEGSGLDESVFIRGNHRNPGPKAPRHFLEALFDPEDKPPTSSSGRQKIAESAVDPLNPFPARVMVNRIWHHLFGVGIVSSVDNFGVQGVPPSNPRLLDHLATEFRSNGWSTKDLIRLLVTSNTYRMSSSPVNPEAERQDPTNRLFHRMNVKRLEGEIIRDSILSISGKLTLEAYGTSVPIHLTPFMQGRGKPRHSGPLDGNGRRSIYIEVRRNFLSPMMLAFDTPIPYTTIGKRTVSNVPAQALILMNDPFVQEQAGHWARKLISENGYSPDAYIENAYQNAFARHPSSLEMKQALEFLHTQQEAYRNQAKGSKEPNAEFMAMNDLCHVLFNVKELVFIN